MFFKISRKSICLCIVMMMTISFCCLTVSGAQNRYLYFDSNEAWAEDASASNPTSAEAKQYISGIYFKAGYLSVKISNRTATLNNPTGNRRSFYFMKDALAADADFTSSDIRKLSLTLSVTKFNAVDDSPQTLWPGLEFANAVKLKNPAIGTYPGYADMIAGYEDTDKILYLSNRSYSNADDSAKKLYPLCSLQLNTEYAIEYVFDQKGVYSVTVNGQTYTEAMDGTPIRECVFQNLSVRPEDAQDGTASIEMPIQKQTTLVYSRFQYGAVTQIGEILPQNPWEPIEVLFEDTPLEPASLGDYVQIQNNKTGAFFTDFTCDYDEALNKLSVMPLLPLDFNTTYTVTLSDRIAYRTASALGITVLGASKSFVTGYERLTVSGLPNSLPAEGEMNVTADITNNGQISGSFTTIAALYRKIGGMVNLLAYTEKPQTLGLGRTATLDCGRLTLPKDEGEYFIKLFCLAEDEAIAKAAVIGRAPVSAGAAVTGDAVITANVETKPDNGRIVLSGLYNGLPNRPVFLRLTNPAGETVYMEQTESGTEGLFAMNCNLQAGAADGLYTCLIHVGGEAPYPATFTMDFSQVKPVVSNLTIGGTPICGKTLTAQYDFFHFGQKADISAITWLADSADGSFAPVGTGRTLTLTDALLTHKVKFTVLARSEGGSVADELQESAEIRVTAAPIISNPRLVQKDNRVTAEYSYSHGLNYEQYNSEFAWYVADSMDGSYTRVGDNLSMYCITAADNGKYCKAEITPRALVPEDYILEGVGDTVTAGPIRLSYTGSAAGGGHTSGSTAGGKGSNRGSGTVSVKKTSETNPPLQQTGETDFTDVRGHWAQNAIYKLYDQGIVTGRSDATFEPEATITRAEFIALLVRALKLQLAGYQNAFNDVSGGDWYADVIQTAANRGFLQGSEGCAYPNQPVTRKEMAALTVRAYETLCGEIKLSGGLLSFADADQIAEWAIDSVCKARELGLIEGVGEGRFDPDTGATRAASCVIIGRILEQIEAAAAKEPEPPKQSGIELQGEKAEDAQPDLNSDDNPLDQYNNKDHTEEAKS